VRFTFEEEDDGALCIGDRDSHKKTKWKYEITLQ
jgi:hypothetical protein